MKNRKSTEEELILHSLEFLTELMEKNSSEEIIKLLSWNFTCASMYLYDHNITEDYYEWLQEIRLDYNIRKEKDNENKDNEIT